MTKNEPAAAAMADFLQGMRRLVLDEAKTARRRMEELWSKPLVARVSEGRAIDNVQIKSFRPDGLIELTCTRNASRFREGDILCLNRSSPAFQPQWMVTLEEDDETQLLVSCGELDLNWGLLAQEPAGWILDEGLIDLSHWILDALKEAGETLAGRQRILPLLMGQQRPRIDAARSDWAEQVGQAFGLNASQCEALAQAYGTDLVYLIQGPPGTGKTHVLARLAQLLVAEGERVLITSFTHRAINNALNKVAEVDPTLPAVKIGPPARAGDSLVENYDNFAASPLADMATGYIVGATPYATRNQRLGGVEFDTVIFDEASQITLPLAVMAMLTGRKYIFIGDQKQLPPVLTTRYSGGAFRDSVFGYLAERGFDTMLTESYRLNAALAEWPSHHFYDGELVSAAGVAERKIDYPRPPARWLDILDPDEPKVFWDLGHRSTTSRSHKEANAVVDLIASLLACGLPAGEIGVVVPYRAQAREIRNRLRDVIAHEESRRLLVVDTVERMQGQEREAIILSLTTSNPAFAADLADFFFQPERLNVAVTRPRTKLIIVGSRHVLTAEPADSQQQEAVALMRELLASCTRFPAAAYE
jgi:DNA replication ATP-dependent helicase Dna2